MCLMIAMIVTCILKATSLAELRNTNTKQKYNTNTQTHCKLKNDESTKGISQYYKEPLINRSQKERKKRKKKEKTGKEKERKKEKLSMNE